MSPRTTQETGQTINRKQVLTFRYRNYRGSEEVRQILPERIWFGQTDWHPDPQWLLDGFDLDRDSLRTFAIDQILSFKKENATDVSDRQGVAGPA